MNSRIILYTWLTVVMLSLAMGLSTKVSAQAKDASVEVDSSSVFLLVRALPDSIMLRWAPDNYRLWMIANKYGYNITRTCLIRNGAFVDKPITEMLTPAPLKPLPLAEWEAMAENNEYAGVAAEAIYGDGFEVDAGSAGIMDIVHKATEQESRFGFALLAADLSREVAQASGLMFVDREARKGEKYIYRVFPAQVPEGLRVDTGYFFTGVDEYLPLPSPIDVKAEPGDKNIFLTWDAVSQQGYFTGFWVERSLDGVDFERLDSSPVINTTPEGHEDSRFHFYRDSLADNSHSYYYRILGVTPFGETSSPSAIVEVKGINEIQSVPRITLAESFDGKSMTLEWEFEKAETEVVDGLKLLRSQRFDGEYQVIADSIPLLQKQVNDQSPLPTGYYRMQAFNSDGEGLMGTPKMVQMVDSIPPAVPLGLTAKADTTGMVHLSWDENTDIDLFGYRVFRANSRNEEFSQLTVESVYLNNYTDTISLKTLSKKVYYKILAVDQRQNWSDFSEILEVDRPDIIPPATPRITSSRIVDNGIELKWVLSPSADVQQQLLYRNSENNSQWQLIKNFSPQVVEYADTSVVPDSLYRYLFVVVDSVGNESKPSALVSGKYQETKKVQWISPNLKINKKKNEILISWEGLVEAKNCAGVLYRKAKGVENKWLVYKSVNLEDYQIVIKEAFSNPDGFEYVIRVTPN